MENIIIEIDKRIKNNTESYRKTKGLKSLEFQAAGLELMKFKNWLLDCQITDLKNKIKEKP